MWMWISELSEVTRIVTREARSISQGHDPAVPESEYGVFAAVPGPLSCALIARVSQVSQSL
jgi:hypothetical protein